MRTYLLIIALLLGVVACVEDTIIVDDSTCGDLVLNPGEECDTTTFGPLSCELFGYEGGALSCTDHCTLDVQTCIGMADTCGDGVLDVGEMCDGAVPGDLSCKKLGYGSGEVVCTETCKLDVSGCGGIETVCGDGIRSGDEECDAADFGDRSCGAFGYYGGTLSCNSDCTVSLSACVQTGKCGDGTVQRDYEECDGPNLGGATCLSLGYYGGGLACSADCSFNTTSCETTGRCGDGTAQPAYGESCDGEDLNGTTCFSLGFQGGTLTCGADCGLDYSACQGYCGDGMKSGTEECDLNDLGESSCGDLGYYGGMLACAQDCTYDLMNCLAFGTCGDGLVNVTFGEECDGANLNGTTCWDLGYHSGTLSCAADCSLDDALCTGTCGDGTMDSVYGEVCDGADLGGQSCLTLGADSGGPLGCASDCRSFDTSNCVFPLCGNGTIDPSEECDGTLLGGMTCRILNYWRGDLYCRNDCSLDVGACHRLNSVATSRYFACGIDSEERTWCWGNNAFGSLGNGTLTDAHVPVEVLLPTGRTFKEIYAGSYVGCAIDDLSQLWCWGHNEHGEVGDGSTTNRVTPVLVNVPAGHTFHDITGGIYHLCALDQSGAAWCWGEGLYGKLGNGTTMDRAVPTAVTMPAGRFFTRLAHQAHGKCALDDLGQVWCWGYNVNGNLGNGSTQDQATPVLISMPAGKTFHDIAGGDQHTCAIDQTNALWCWGYNQYGSIGDGTTTNRLTPVQVTVPGGVASLGFGNFESCAISLNGSTYCWGYNVSGQLGLGDYTTRTVPTVLTQPAGVQFVDIQGGYRFTCAHDVYGRVWCWGLNDHGQLASGDTTNRTYPNLIAAP